MEIEGITPSMLWNFVVVLVGLATLAVLALNLITKIREIRKPNDDSRKTVNDMLANDNNRIEHLEKVSRKQDDEIKLLLTGEMAMIHHMLDGNHTESLKESQHQIEYFLTFGKLPE